MLLQMTINVADTAATLANGTGNATEMTLSFWEMAVKGGWIMIPIVLLSFVAVYIFVERFKVINEASKDDTSFMDSIKNHIHQGEIDQAVKLCNSANSPISRMIEKGISRIGRPLIDINAAVENVGKQEVAKLEKGLPTLATVSGGAPMIGFLGTVMGMIRAFYDMASAGNNVDVGLLSNGIYTAMVTTVAGLIVGIIAYFAYNFLVAKVDNLVSTLEAKTTEFMDILNEPAN